MWKKHQIKSIWAQCKKYNIMLQDIADSYTKKHEFTTIANVSSVMLCKSTNDKIVDTANELLAQKKLFLKQNRKQVA